MECVRCGAKDAPHYANDRTCKECRKAMVRANRAKNVEYYREYDRHRFQNDPKVKARHQRYQATPAGRRSIRASKERWLEENPEKRRAQTAVGNALRSGVLKKLDACEYCGCQDSRIEGHHPSYAEDMKLCVTWLCSPCHRRLHKEFA